jgi:hypothetical protein
LRRNVAVAEHDSKREPVDHRLDVGHGEAVSLRLPDGRLVWLSSLDPGATSESCCLVVTARERVAVRGGEDTSPAKQAAT